MTPKFGWEVPQPAHVLVASALARARPVALAAGGDRLGGLPDHVVAERYAALACAVASLSHPGSGRPLHELEGEPAEGGTRQGKRCSCALAQITTLPSSSCMASARAE